ncbi:MAG TPA: nucleotidyltransferase family protein [Allosphingosinicella sp.]
MAACCRWPPSAARDERVRLAAAVGIDWDGFGKLVRRHRVAGLVHDGLVRAGVEAPAPLAARLADESGEIARQNLAFAAESLRLDALFAPLGHLFLKGVTLNMLAYGSLAYKQAVDVDLLVTPADYEAAIALLRGAGYRCIVPGPEPRTEEILLWVKGHKHSNWVSAAGLSLELHAGLVDNPLLVQGLGAHSPGQQVEVAPGKALPTLATEELFAYLCAHGAAHGWARLKWLADVAALVSHEDGPGIERLHARSVELGGGRSAGQALLLSSILFGLELPPALAARLEGDRGTRILARMAIRNFTLGGMGRELDEMVLGTAGIHLSYLLLGRGAGFKLRQLRRTLLGGPSEGAPLAKRLLRPIAFFPRWLLRRAREARAVRR